MRAEMERDETRRALPPGVFGGMETITQDGATGQRPRSLPEEREDRKRGGPLPRGVFGGMETITKAG